MQAFFKNESGATAIEYALIAALIAVAIIGAAGTLGGDLSTKFTEIAAEIDTAGDAAPAAE
ncbi:MAG: Flp family type IVb pilin [Henriciella sp.]